MVFPMQLVFNEPVVPAQFYANFATAYAHVFTVSFRIMHRSFPVCDRNVLSGQPWHRHSAHKSWSCSMGQEGHSRLLDVRSTLYDGHPMNKLQNDVIVLIFKT